MERRKSVAEDNAKRNVGRLLKFLALVLTVGGVVWLLFSPWLSISRVETAGVVSSGANAILVDRGVVAGTPMITLSTSGTEAALMEDPWVALAEVSMSWPNLVTVEVVERVPVAWAKTAGGWALRAVDGVALAYAEEPDETSVRVDMTDLVDVAVTTSPDFLGALEFGDALPSNLRQGTVVYLHEGELWAEVSDYQVRLGRPVEMAEKALSLAALLRERIPGGSTLVLIAPTNPAVMTPQADDENGG
jgi:hypothetical protein